MMNRRLALHPEWFKSERICFLDSRITQFWERDWPNFRKCELLPANALDWYSGKLPRENPTEKRWGKDIDDLYIPLNINRAHWVALHVSIPKRHIIVYDSLHSHVKTAEMDDIIKPYTTIMPHLLNVLCLPDEKHIYPRKAYTYDRPKKGVPQQSNGGDCGVFTLKYIECLSLGYPGFPRKLANRNIPAIREKIAVDLFNEMDCRGPVAEDPADYVGIDMYDPHV